MNNTKKFLNLKGSRIVAGLTPSDMANVIGVKVDTYRKKENGQVEFRLSELVLISKKLNMPADYLFS